MYVHTKISFLKLLCCCLCISLTTQTFAQTVTIPVVIHVMHRQGQGIGFGENLTETRVQRGLALLNAAFAAQTPFGGSDCAAGHIQFCLAQQDANGATAVGYTRNPSALVSANFNINNDTALKNEVRWDTRRYLNIWLVSDICSNGGCAPTAYAFNEKNAGSATDGLVTEAVFWGTQAGAAMSAHELGHYFGLRHTYEGGCNNANCYTYGDAVCDTPPDNSVFDGCVANSSCGLTDYNWNFMDANDWGCLRGFTAMQQEKMDKTLQIVRNSLLHSKGCEPPCANNVTASITASATTALVGESLNFTANAINAAQYNWFINNNPVGANAVLNYTFNDAGVYMVRLSANNAQSCSRAADTIYITVSNPVRARLYVNQNAAGANNGTTWQNAFTDLQNALVIAQPNTDIWVAKGTYSPSANPDPTASFVVPDGVNLYGGFEGTETTLEKRIKCINKTILTSNNNNNNADRSRCLLKIKNLISKTTIDNFDIVSAYHNLQDAIIERGAIFIENTNVDIKDCRIYWNEGENGAGLVIVNNQNKTVVVDKSRIVVNRATKGSSIWAENTNMIIENTIFTLDTDHDNADGSTFYIKDQTNGAYIVNHCTFIDNAATNAVIFIENPTNITIKNTIIQKNAAQFAIMGDGANFSYSNIATSQTNTPFVNCINTDPLFISVNTSMLSANSPCIDAGINTDDIADLYGNQRIVNNRTDMGCHEYAACPKYVTTITQSNINFDCIRGTNADVQINILQKQNCATYTFEYQGVINTTGAYQALGQGAHFIQIYDAANPQCKDSVRVVINGVPPLQVEATVLQHACRYADNGVLVYTQTGGTPPFTAMLNTVAITENTISRLPANTYTVSVRDANNCLAKATTKIEQLPPLVATAKVKNYNCDARTGNVKLETSSGTVVGYTWQGATTGNAIVPDSIAGLTAGVYTITITASTGCSATTTARVAEQNPITADAQFRNPKCFGGSNGNLEILNVQNATLPVFYSINNGAVSSQPVFSNLPKGTYIAQVEDRNNCKWSRTVILEDGDVLKAILNKDTVISIGDSAFVRTKIYPENATVQYAWNNTENLSCYTCAEPRAFPLITTIYTVTITDVWGCTATDEMEITVINNKNVYVPNIFTPNNDGINDYLSVYCGGAAETVQLMRIFNRWGGLIYENKNFPVNNPFSGWNGKMQTESVDTGVYLYEVEVRFLDNEVKKVSGNVTLYRR